ncbi:hypothetical protein [Terrihabitans sp. B22-R8]|uniref:hypothetical protein n=1 Tax=Terrihabitans sp. B22-R8 TaxID=3425128 RepID=UPI00403CDF16
MKRCLLLVVATLLAIPAAMAKDQAFATQANIVCRDIIDARDYRTFKAARDAGIDLIARKLRKQGAPSPDEAARVSQLLRAVNADLERAIAQMRNLPSSPALEAYLAYGRSKIEINRKRLAFLADLENWQWPPVDDLDTSSVSQSDALARLGFDRRDCAHLFDSLGNPPEFANFIPIAAQACSAAHNDLSAPGLDLSRKQNLEAMTAARRGNPQSPQAAPALRALANAWVLASQAFILADASLPEKPPMWEENLARFVERARIFEMRANAIEHGDQDAIKEAFAQRPSIPDFARMGLRETSCMALARSM